MSPHAVWRAVISGSAVLAVVLALAPAAQQTATAASTDYQAEDATISQGVVESNHAGYTGTGFVNYDNLVGSYVEWTVTAPAGPADVTLRYANGTTAARPMDFTVNGVAGAVGITFPGTGDWTSWQTKTVRLTLAAGTNKIRARATTADGGPNADKLTVTPTSTTPPLRRRRRTLPSATSSRTRPPSPGPPRPTTSASSGTRSTAAATSSRSSTRTP